MAMNAAIVIYVLLFLSRVNKDSGFSFSRIFIVSAVISNSVPESAFQLHL